jgi:hypothetical protein
MPPQTAPEAKPHTPAVYQHPHAHTHHPRPAMAVSNNITACITLLALICAVPVIASGIWFASAQGEECARLARWPVAILGGLLLLVALAGFVGAYWNRRRLLAFYLCAMAVLIVLLIVLLVWAFAVSRGSGAYPVLGRAYEDYRLDGFSMWLRGYVSDDPGRWEKIKACLAVSDTCKKLQRQGPGLTADQFYQSQLSPLQVPELTTARIINRLNS